VIRSGSIKDAIGSRVVEDTWSRRWSQLRKITMDFSVVSLDRFDSLSNSFGLLTWKTGDGRHYQPMYRKSSSEGVGVPCSIS
jgi:hypothetical protein